MGAVIVLEDGTTIVPYNSDRTGVQMDRAMDRGDSVGDISQLTTTNKSSIVEAINEVNSEIENLNNVAVELKSDDVALYDNDVSLYQAIELDDNIIPFLWESGGIASATGEDTDNSSYIRTAGYFLCKAGTSYTLSSTEAIYRSTYNVSDKSFRSQSQMQNGEKFKPSSDVYVRLSCSASISAKPQISKSNVIAQNIKQIKEENSIFQKSLSSLVFLETESAIPTSWEPGGIDNQGQETDNEGYRRTSIVQGKNCYISCVSDGYTIFRYMYNLDGTFVNVSSTGVQNTSFYFREDRLYRFQAYKSGSTYSDLYEKVSFTKKNYGDALITVSAVDFWEIGGCAIATGNYTVSETRVRTTEDMSAFVEEIEVDSGYSFLIYLYDKVTGNYIGAYGSDFVPMTEAHWISTRCYIGDYLRKHPTYRMIIVARNNNDTSVTPSSISGKIHFKMNTIKFNEFLSNRYISSYPYHESLLAAETISGTTITDLSDLNGKTCYLVGDSMVAGGTLHTYLGNRLGLVCTNYGYGGSTIAINNTTLENLSIVERVLGIADSNNIEGSADVWVVWGGYNDASYRNTPLGDIKSEDNATLYGALKTICKTIQEKTNNPRILLVTMHQSTGRITSAHNCDGKGLYVQRMREAFHEVGEMFGIPVLDLYKNGGISRVNDKQLTSDGVHLNDKGRQFIYPKIANAIKNMV